MKKVIRRKPAAADFSLHDARIIDFEWDEARKNLRLCTDYGFADLRTDEMSDGDILIEGVSLEDSYVCLLKYIDVLCGNPGRFSGEKMTLADFIRVWTERYTGFDLMGEYYGFRSFVTEGFLMTKSQKPEALEAYFEIYYEGDFVYELREQE